MITTLPANLDAHTLRDLSAVLKARADVLELTEPEMVARRGLTPEGLDKLADLYLSGGWPTCGFGRHQPEPTTAGVVRR